MANGPIYVKLANANGTLLCGVASIGEAGLQQRDKLRLAFGNGDTITSFATRAADHALEIAEANQWCIPQQAVAVACAYLIANAGLAGDFVEGGRNRPAQDTVWVDHNPPQNEDRRKTIQGFLTQDNLRAAATSLLVVKWNWFQTNHHVGQGEYSPFVRKYIRLAWQHLIGPEGRETQTTDDKIIAAMWICGHWASTHLALKVWGFDWEGSGELEIPDQPMPPLVVGTRWDNTSADGKRIIIPANTPEPQAEEMHSRARYYFDPAMIRERALLRYSGTGVLAQVYPYGCNQGWAHLYLILDTDLSIRKDSYPAGTRQVSTSCAAMKSFIRGNAPILTMIPQISDFIVATALMSAIPEQERPLYHIGGPYLTNQPRRDLRSPVLLGRAGMLVQACMVGSAMEKSPLFKADGKFLEAPDYDPNLLTQMKAFRSAQGRTAGANVAALLEHSETASGDMRSRAVLAGLTMGHEGDVLKNVVRKCMLESRAMNNQSTEITEDELNEELAAVEAEIERQRLRGQNVAAGIPPDGPEVDEGDAEADDNNDDNNFQEGEVFEDGGAHGGGPQE